MEEEVELQINIQQIEPNPYKTEHAIFKITWVGFGIVIAYKDFAFNVMQMGANDITTGLTADDIFKINTIVYTSSNAIVEECEKLLSAKIQPITNKIITK